MRSRILNALVAFVFVATSSGILTAFPLQASVLPYMPEASQMVQAGEAYDLPCIIGMEFKSDNPFLFTFIIDPGDMKLERALLQKEVDKVGKYFLAALTIPEDDLWVNLSPYEQNRISTDSLAQTDLGKDMLGEDYVLKQLTASVTYPESEVGKKYWGTVYERIQQALGTVNVPVDTFNKVWITPDKIKVLEGKTKALIDSARFKVLMEEDYLAREKNQKAKISSSQMNSMPRKERKILV